MEPLCVYTLQCDMPSVLEDLRKIADVHEYHDKRMLAIYTDYGPGGHVVVPYKEPSYVRVYIPGDMFLIHPHQAAKYIVKKLDHLAAPERTRAVTRRVLAHPRFCEDLARLLVELTLE